VASSPSSSLCNYSCTSPLPLSIHTFLHTTFRNS
jgi:hypothetical protein